uniref:Uncharacterized protein n=1 Tax=Arundo donax TaxID=35708 RepID=A0A0A8YPE4_ARUDO
MATWASPLREAVADQHHERATTVHPAATVWQAWKQAALSPPPQTTFVASSASPLLAMAAEQHQGAAMVHPGEVAQHVKAKAAMFLCLLEENAKEVKSACKLGFAPSNKDDICWMTLGSNNPYFDKGIRTCCIVEGSFLLGFPAGMEASVSELGTCICQTAGEPQSCWNWEQQQVDYRFTQRSVHLLYSHVRRCGNLSPTWVCLDCSHGRRLSSSRTNCMSERGVMS